MKRDFDSWFETMQDHIRTWDYYTNFDKVHRNVEKFKRELNLLNSLIGSPNIEKDFNELIEEYPKTLKAIPILLAKRDYQIVVKDIDGDYSFNFENINHPISDYTLFMRKSGLFNLMEYHIISNLYDYVTGVEVGLDTNARKNRTGTAMEDLVEKYIVKSGFVNNVSYFKELRGSEIEEKFKIKASQISKTSKKNADKRFDFVLLKNDHIYAIETNFYSTSGSKLNETSRSYKNIAIESQNIENFTFIWITDGKGWKQARNNLRETFNELETLYNISDLENGVLEKL